MTDFFSQLEERGTPRVLVLSDVASGLRAFVVLDSLTLGPAAGGVRTRAYSSEEEALADASRLARAMTLKCSLAGLEAGGGKAVVLLHPGVDRERAFEQLGRHVEELGGLFRTAGDLGTTSEDLAAMARNSRFVYTEEVGLFAAAGRGLLRCLEACAEVRGLGTLTGLRVAIQGCGGIGASLGRALAPTGAEIVVADLDPERAEALARELGAKVLAPEEILCADVDVIAPCAVGGVLTPELIPRLRAWGICGGANNQLADPTVAGLLAERGILYVPDFLASAGAVIEGVGKTIQQLDDCLPLIDRMGETARSVLREAEETRRPTTEVAERRALERIATRAGLEAIRRT